MTRKEIFRLAQAACDEYANLLDLASSETYNFEASRKDRILENLSPDIENLRNKFMIHVEEHKKLLNEKRRDIGIQPKL